MKLITISLLLLMLVSTSSIHAQVEGAAAVNASNLGKNNEWQNWIFAISAMVTATAGILVASMDRGAPLPEPHSH